MKDKEKIKIEYLASYLPHKVSCSYKVYSDEEKRLVATLTGINTDGIETTYKRKRKGCVGDIISFEGNNNICDLDFKLILRNLSDLTKEIEHNGEKFVPIIRLNKMRGVEVKDDEYTLFENDEKERLSVQVFECYGCSWLENMHFYYDPKYMSFFGDSAYKEPSSVGEQYSMFQKLFEWHFNVFNLDKKLWIDVNKLSDNPYK